MSETVQYVADSPSSWLNILEWLKYELRESMLICKELELVSRCSDCFKKNRKVTIKFSENKAHIQTWNLNCHYDDLPVEHEYIISNFNIDKLYIDVKKTKKIIFELK